MLDYWTGDVPIYIVAPAIVGYEKQEAPFLPHGRCAFLVAGRCQLHDLGLKPTEGRLAHHDGRGGADLHEALAQSWDNDEAQAFADAWAEAHVYGE